MRKYVFIILEFCVAAAALFAMSQADTDTGTEGKPVVAVSIMPHQYFVQSIAGDYADVLVLVGQGQSPHSYEPTPRQIEKLSRAAVWILSGTDFEKALREKVRSQFPDLPVVDGTDGVTFRELNDHHHDDHGHTLDPHSWLGREPAKILAGHVYRALVEIDPSRTSIYKENYTALVAEIDSTFDALSKRLAVLSGQTVLVYHPAFGYFLDEFDLHQEAVETGGREPTVRTLAALVEKAREEGARAVFVQEQFSPDSAKRIADEIGVPVVSLDPLSPDWIGNIRRMGAALEDALITRGN